MGGYPLRGNPILGLVDENDRVSASGDTLDKMSYTTLGYLNGPGAKVNASRDNPARSDVKSRNYKQQSVVPKHSETHGGEDVGRCLRLMPSFVCLLSSAPLVFYNFLLDLLWFEPGIFQQKLYNSFLYSDEAVILCLLRFINCLTTTSFIVLCAINLYHFRQVNRSLIDSSKCTLLNKLTCINIVILLFLLLISSSN